MAWTGNFRGVDYKQRAEFLRNYLAQRPAGLADCLARRPTKKAQMSSAERFRYGYKDVLSFIVSSLCVRSDFRYVSKEAENQLKSHGINKPVSDHLYNKKAHEEYRGLTSEHTIPVKVIVAYLATMDRERMTTDFLAEFIEKVSGIAIITADENKKLNKELKDKLPDGTTLDGILDGTVRHDIRYEKAGIAIAKTNHRAEA